MFKKNGKKVSDMQILDKMWSQSLEENLISDSHSNESSNFESKEADHNVSSATIEKTDHKTTNKTADKTLPISEAVLDKNSKFINTVYSKDEKVARILAYGKVVFLVGTGLSALINAIAHLIEVLK